MDLDRFLAARAPELHALLASADGCAANGRRGSRSHSRRKQVFRFKGKAPEGSRRKKGAAPLSRRVRRKIAFQELAQGKDLAGFAAHRLVTHVWHAKRFYMGDMWGYCLAAGVGGRGRGARRVLKTAREGALLHDASYWNPIQLDGDWPDISTILGLVCEPLTGLAPHAGACSVNTMVHSCGRVPYAPIGPAVLIFHPLHEPPSARLWIWVHAAALQETLESLQAACQNTTASCRLKQGELARLELFGTKSLQVLQKVARPRLAGAFEKQHTLFSSGAEPAPKAVVPVEVYDPRDISILERCFPSGPQGNRETNSEYTSMLGDQGSQLPSTWGDIMERVSQRMGDSALFAPCVDLEGPLSEKSMNRKQQRYGLAHYRLIGQQRYETSEWKACSIILLKHGCRQLPGWSVILPVGWVHAFWTRLTTAGAQVVGQRERRWLMALAGRPSYPYDFPDCPAYQRQVACDVEKRILSGSRKPPGKRSSPDGPVPFCGVVARSGAVLRQHLHEQDVDAGFELDSGARLGWPAVQSQQAPRRFLRILVTAAYGGVPQGGGVLYAPLVEDFDSWISSPQEWRGGEAGTRKGSGVGFITSAAPRRSAASASAVCDLEELCKLRSWQAADGRWSCSENQVLVLYHNPRSTKLRPALARIAMGGNLVDDAL